MRVLILIAMIALATSDSAAAKDKISNYKGEDAGVVVLSLAGVGSLDVQLDISRVDAPGHMSILDQPYDEFKRIPLKGLYKLGQDVMSIYSELPAHYSEYPYHAKVKLISLRPGKYRLSRVSTSATGMIAPGLYKTLSSRSKADIEFDVPANGKIYLGRFLAIPIARASAKGPVATNILHTIRLDAHDEDIAVARQVGLEPGDVTLVSPPPATH